MKPIKIAAALLFFCLAGMGFSAVLIDHGLASRLAFDLFAMAGLLVSVPAFLIVILTD
jgi:di/tricarboxylate transporter